MQRLVFLLAFAAAVLALPEAWSGWRMAIHQADPGAWARAVGWSALVVGALLGAGLVMYAADRRAGRVRRRIGLYERILSRVVGERGSAHAIILLALASLACVGVVVYGELTDHRLVGAGAMGVLLMLYSFLVLLFRKAGITAREE
ncbi:MAG: hypothetical protein QN172_00180 [Armatimonadota bacterium]|nr:hypothetical protein [Armatimonadota bacterium]MDR7439047.1 hypothetical protein [Armatimonadota bacterium]MDR7563016.1 hypothetical protein [Armatimonadota bacterium]MDR7567667.1 hypothetical protein [Armatimonadota bacterium]MDR7600860.1 hypothetical protein [Armatimonadota bacterium]